MAAEDDDRKEFDWDLPIYVPTIGVHRTLRVTSNESIGAVMIKLATKLGQRNLLAVVLCYVNQFRNTRVLYCEALLFKIL